MAKTSYKVPSSLNRSFLDHEITLSKGGWAARPSPIKQLFFFGGGALVLLWVTTSTFVASSGPVFITLFVIWGLLTIVYFGALTKTNELRVTTVPALLSYLPARARHVLTRRGSDPSGFYSIVGIHGIDQDGRIHFVDGSEGQVYLVVGSASYLLFDEDRVRILDRVDAFWRKVDTSCEWSFITTKEPQRIYHQVANLERRNHALQVRHPDLVELQDEQYDILTQHVGGKFTSIHQYLLLKGKSADALRRGHTVLQAEIEGSALMIKEAMLLNREETEPMLRLFYQGVDIAPTTSRGLG
ncbi:hypothetical protein C8K30_1011083 [Promicromonospora sp. AC04]|uniref:hypothetical protein n=1 Tax=Promicromonospora sp. AC04 TaxID=2135723 RepID=UPI000D3A32D6|nr:hypothetical protein [Promicromonospora sp. AC04]PUB32557.1 hypothetical protein C8K30_1011083 [Promicromonospora sp. AC04]